MNGPLSGPESHGSVSSVVRGSLPRDGSLSDPESHGSVGLVPFPTPILPTAISPTKNQIVPFRLLSQNYFF